MEYTKLNDTTLKTVEVVTIEKELTKDEVLDRIANIENRITTREKRDTWTPSRDSRSRQTSSRIW